MQPALHAQLVFVRRSDISPTGEIASRGREHLVELERSKQLYLVICDQKQSPKDAATRHVLIIIRINSHSHSNVILPMCNI